MTKQFKIFGKNIPELSQQPIIKSFLRYNHHRELLKRAICFPTSQNKSRLDEAFKTFYGQAKSLTYFSRLIYYNAINFDKNRQYLLERETPILDQPIQSESDFTQKDMLYDDSPDIVDQIKQETLADFVEDSTLYKAVKQLTSKQQDVLTYKYVHNLNNQDIARLFNVSLQNITKIHRKALQNLKRHIQGEKDYNDNT